MLFDRKPKVRREDFYDREEELKLFLRGLEVGEGLIVVYGVRRIGKTSFVYVALNEAEVPFVPVDLRKFSESPSLLSPSSVLRLVEDALAEYDKVARVRKAVEKVLSRVESINVNGVTIRTRGSERLAAEILERFDAWARRRSTRLVVVLDEAQELRVVPSWRKILAWSLDNLENVTFVVTGSEIGVLRDFLRLDDPNSPLFGRSRLEIALPRFSRDKSIDFLKRGFLEIGLSVPREEIEDAVDKLDGIVGWLTYYGHYRASYGVSHDDALARVEGDAVELLTSELEKIVKYSPRRYVAILWAISLGLRSWSTIKRFTEGVAGPVPDKNFDRLLQNLVRYGFVEKTPNLEYRAVDPLLPKAVEKLRKKYRV